MKYEMTKPQYSISLYESCSCVTKRIVVIDLQSNRLYVGR